MALYTSLTETDNSLSRWFLETEPLAQSWMVSTGLRRGLLSAALAPAPGPQGDYCRCRCRCWHTRMPPPPRSLLKAPFWGRLLAFLQATFDRVKRHGYVYTEEDRDAAGLIRGDYNLKRALALGAGAACFFGTAACRRWAHARVGGAAAILHGQGMQPVHVLGSRDTHAHRLPCIRNALGARLPAGLASLARVARWSGQPGTGWPLSS